MLERAEIIQELDRLGYELDLNDSSIFNFNALKSIAQEYELETDKIKSKIKLAELIKKNVPDFDIENLDDQSLYSILRKIKGIDEVKPENLGKDKDMPKEEGSKKEAKEHKRMNGCIYIDVSNDKAKLKEIQDSGLLYGFDGINAIIKE